LRDLTINQNQKNMKIRTLLFGIAGFLAATSLSGQTVVSVAPGEGTLESAINKDTTASGERVDANTIYELEPGGVYIMNSGIKFVGADGTLTMRMKADAPAGSKKPVIVRMKKEGVDVSANSIDGSLVMENLHYQVMEISENQLPWAAFNISGKNHTLKVDGCLVEYCNGIIWNMNSVPEGAKIDIRNSYFRDLNNFGQWWASRVVQCKVPVDEFLLENNTITGGGLTVLGQSCLFEYAVINHNTIINNVKYPFLNQFWKEAYITNNLFVNVNMVGEDAENVATGGQDPDGRNPVDNGDGTITTHEMLHGITGIDTVIAKQISIQSKFYNEDSTLTSDVDEISDYIFYCADNVVASSSTLDAYYAKETGNYTGTLASYLTWSGVGEVPFDVVNVPGIWRNSRAEALDADWNNILWENNSVYQMKAEDIGFATEVLPQAAADVFAQWNQNAWAVPDAEKPTDFSAFYFGDYDPATIPGVEVESAPPGEGGITKVSDMVEDFSYTADLVSESDGLKIGALHWDDIAYDSQASIAAVKAAYQGATGIEDAKVALSSKFQLKNYPNPFSSKTTVSFYLDRDSYVNLKVYDVSGRLVSELISEVRGSGLNTVEFAPDFAASSTYFYKLTTDFGTETRKMMMLK